MLDTLDLIGGIVEIAIVVLVVVMLIKRSRKKAAEKKNQEEMKLKVWSDYEQSAVETVNRNWRAYLQRARREDQLEKTVAGSLSLDSLIHNFLWCVYDLSKHAFSCNGMLTIKAEGNSYSIQAYACLDINDSEKYQTLYRCMVETFFIDTPGIRLEFSDCKKDIDHDNVFPWVSKDHLKMIPTMDYYVVGMHFSLLSINSMSSDGLLQGSIKTPNDILKYKAKEHTQYGLSYTVNDTHDGVIKMNFTSHYTEPKVD